MARKPRIEFEGAFYHIIIRGNQRQKVFKEEDDFQKYLNLLAFYKDRHKYFLYAYVLMNNHVHLLIETHKIPLSKIIQGISQSYTMYFNRKYRTVGHLFQGRYKAILCDKDAYLLSLIKYIHLNPVRAKTANAAGQYRWSSYRSYCKLPKNDIVDTDTVLRMFSEDKSRARKLFVAYIDDGVEVKKEDIYRTVSQRILGEEKFLDKVMEKIDERFENKRKRHEFSLKEIAETTGKVMGITIDQLKDVSKGRKILAARKLASLVAKEYGYKGLEISAYLQKDPSVISRYLKDKNLELDMKRVIGMLSNCNKQA